MATGDPQAGNPALEHLSGGRPESAVKEMEEAVRLDPGSAELHKNLGNAYRANGNPQGALASYLRSIELSPDYLPSLYNAGLLLRETGRADEAERYFRRVLELAPEDADALLHLGSLLLARQNHAEAAALSRVLVRLRPENPYAWLQLGSAALETPGSLQEAQASLRRCVQLAPDLAQAHYQLGLACKRLELPGEAEAAYRRVLELEPESAEACNDLANILQDQGRLDEADELYRRAIAIQPDYASAHSNLAALQVRRGMLREAAASLRTALEHDPAMHVARMNLGNVCSLLGEREEAARHFAALLAERPGDATAAACLLHEMQHLCDWSRFGELSDVKRRAVDAGAAARIEPFSLLSIASTRAEQLRCARNYARRIERNVAAERERLQFRFDPGPRTRLRIGYLSADLHEHATAYLTAGLFELHDRSRFEVIAYSYGREDASPMRARLRRAFDRFVDLAPLPHAQAAQTIHTDRVDILVDLKGYTFEARGEIVALRPAPIQVNYLGYPGTMGADFIDYCIVDRHIAPADHAADYREKLVWMPASYQVNDRLRPVGPTPSRGQLGLPEAAFVFCCFNQSYKILPEQFAIWLRLLQAVPGSVLWLLEGEQRAAENLRREVRERGIAPERLVFAPRWPLARHLGRMRSADLFLDTLPYNAHTTASDALWAGLPVLSCAGATFASRVGASLLHAVGLPELIAESPAAYETLAVRLARDPRALAALRGKLADARRGAPLFDTPRFTRDLEAAYRQMWERYVSGAPPCAFEAGGP